MAREPKFRVAALVVVSVMVGSTAHPQGRNVDSKLLDELETATMPQQHAWQKQFEEAKTREEKLTLLRKAWFNSFDRSLSDLDRETWHNVWLLEYKRALIEDSMPDPYPH